MNATWADIETAPKDGTKILLSQEDKIIIGWCVKVYADCFNQIEINHKWMSESLVSTYPTHWMPLPKLPRKEHKCKDGNFLCESTKIGLVLAHFGVHPKYARIPVNYCPFCGEKAEKE